MIGIGVGGGEPSDFVIALVRGPIVLNTSVQSCCSCSIFGV